MGRGDRDIARVRGALLGKRQEGVDVILTEFKDARLMLCKNLLDISRGAIATANPYHFGWKSENETSLMKIGILRHNDEVVFTGKFPDHGVIRVPQAHNAHMRRTWVDCLQVSHQARR
jgi:hypothetical protein